MLIERVGQLYSQWGAPHPVRKSARTISEQIQALHQFLDDIEVAIEDRKQLFMQSQQMRKKPIKLAYLLLASETLPDAIPDAFVRANLLSTTQTSTTRPNRPEILMWCAGARATARGVHPFIVFLIMSSFFGLDVATSEYEWLRERAKNTKIELEEFIVPGELTENIEEVLKEPRYLQRTIRAAGMPLSASALAGCSLYYIEKQSLS